MNKIIHYIRHCESVYNVDQHSQQLDCDLSSKGLEHAKTICNEFHYDLVLCSPMKRTLDTILNSQLKYNKLIQVENLRERKGAICDFKIGEEIVEESVSELLLRTESIKEMLRNINNKKILIVGHADFFFYFTSKVIKDEYFGTWLKNGEIYYDVVDFL